MMKRMGFLLGVLMACGVSVAYSQDRGFGLGVMIGEPTGISAKNWISGRNAIDFGAAWSFRGRGFFHLHADYLWHFPDLIRASERFTLYTGLGGRLGAGRGSGIIGARMVGGFAWWPRNVPLDVFIEFAPIVDLAPATNFTVNGGIGLRYFF